MNIRNFLSAAMIVLLLPTNLAAQPAGECTQDSDDEACGTPDQSGGGGCGCGGGSILIAFTDEGDSYQYADDYDNDGREDNADNCPFEENSDQQDSDSDGYGNACDNCVMVTNDQRDSDGDGNGDACDDDSDADGIEDVEDNCPLVPNPAQADLDGDGRGNACDVDDDNDGCEDVADNCPLQPAGECLDTGAVVPDECFDDEDADRIPDQIDNCAGSPNTDQEDSDEDGSGDACDTDLDNDGVQNHADNCLHIPNPNQMDADRDFIGNACDPHYCYVVNGDAEDCLDPNAPFMVYASSEGSGEVGEGVQLNLFANREGKAIRYTWTADDGVISNPQGSVSVSEAYNYRYDTPPIFTANKPGTYVVKLTAELAFEDEGYTQTADVSYQEITISAGRGTGCNSGGPTFPSLTLVALAWFFIRSWNKRAERLDKSKQDC